jgi:hypothetical protein
VEVLVELWVATCTVATVIGADATVVKIAGLPLLAVELPETGTVLEDATDDVLLVGRTLLVTLPEVPVIAVPTPAFTELEVAGAVDTAATVVLAGAADGRTVIVPLELGAALARSEISCELLDTGIEVTVGAAADRLVERAPVVEAMRLSTGVPGTRELTVLVVELSTLLTAVAAAAAVPGAETTVPASGSASPVLFKPTAGALRAVPKMPPGLRICAS